MKNGIIVLLVLLIVIPVSAESIALKSGKVIEGKILEQNEQLIKVDAGVGVSMTYYLDDIESIGGQHGLTADSFSAVSSTVEGEIMAFSGSGNVGWMKIKANDGREFEFKVKENTVFEGRSSFRDMKVFDKATVTYTTVDNINYTQYLKIVPKPKRVLNNIVPTRSEVIHIDEDDPLIIKLKQRMQNDPKSAELSQAASSGDITKVNKYLADGADVNILIGIPGLENTPLGYASSSGYLEVVKALVKYGADVNRPGWGDCPPLFFAATSGHIEIVKYLIENGADVNQKISEEFGGTIIKQMGSKHPDIVELLKAAGAK
jgi:hypothetical protein